MDLSFGLQSVGSQALSTPTAGKSSVEKKSNHADDLPSLAVAVATQMRDQPYDDKV
jgi:hypothetical protein